jgi:hypothetical protein
MGMYDVDKDIYKAWFEEKTISIEKLTREEIEARIIEIAKIEFFAKRENAMLHQQFDKITGRKGIAPWLKADRDNLITDPDIKVNWEGEPRKKEKKPKSDNIKEFLGIDMKEMIREAKARKGKPQSLDEALNEMVNSPKEEKPKITEEEAKSKADALKEKMRLAKLGSQ